MNKLIIMFVLSLWSALAAAHKASDSYLSLTIQNNQIQGRWDIALRDIDYPLDLDDNDDGALTWGELKAKSSELSGYALSRLKISADANPCFHRQTSIQVDEHTDGRYAVLFFNSDCGTRTPAKLIVDYRLFAGLDPQHRGLLKLSVNKADAATAVLIPGKEQRAFDLSFNRSAQTELTDFVIEGIWHIWLGFDHILFLFSLLFPAVLVYEKACWRPAATFNDALWEVVKVVTAFTLAHSITLTVSALGYIDLPSRWVESAIAASVIAAALNNLTPVFTKKRALLAFSFGLIHGFGFASVLAGLELNGASRMAGILGFNLGVEIGQLALVAVFLPIAYKISRYPLYPPLVLKTGSLGIAGLAGLWLIERAFSISIGI